VTSNPRDMNNEPPPENTSQQATSRIEPSAEANLRRRGVRRADQLEHLGPLAKGASLLTSLIQFATDVRVSS